MPVIKFPCPLCQKLMAVGPELAVRKVRCPHCQQVLVAPAAAPAGGPVDAADPFHFVKPRDEEDSIFGEPVDEDVFGTPKPTFDMPRTPTPPAAENTFVADLAPLVPSPAEYDGSISNDRSAAARRRLRSTDAGAGGKANWVLALLVPYALSMT